MTGRVFAITEKQTSTLVKNTIQWIAASASPPRNDIIWMYEECSGLACIMLCHCERSEAIQFLEYWSILWIAASARPPRND